MPKDDERRLHELADLVSRMRAAQKNYFRSRSGTALEMARRLEKEVDRRLKEVFDEQQLLFDD